MLPFPEHLSPLSILNSAERLDLYLPPPYIIHATPTTNRYAHVKDCNVLCTRPTTSLYTLCCRLLAAIATLTIVRHPAPRSHISAAGTRDSTRRRSHAILSTPPHPTPDCSAPTAAPPRCTTTAQSTDCSAENSLVHVRHTSSPPCTPTTAHAWQPSHPRDSARPPLH